MVSSQRGGCSRVFSACLCTGGGRVCVCTLSVSLWPLLSAPASAGGAASYLLSRHVAGAAGGEQRGGAEGGAVPVAPPFIVTAPMLIVPSTHTHPVGTIRRSDGNRHSGFPV